MNDEDKIKLMFLVGVIFILIDIVLLFRIVHANCEFTAWMLEHGRIK